MKCHCNAGHYPPQLQGSLMQIYHRRCVDKQPLKRTGLKETRKRRSVENGRQIYCGMVLRCPQYAVLRQPPAYRATVYSVPLKQMTKTSSTNYLIRRKTGRGVTKRDESKNELDQPELIPKIIGMIKKYSSMWSGQLGEITATQHRINLKTDSVPMRQPPYRVGHKSREIITQQVHKMPQAGVIKPAQSEWASLVVLVTKKDEKPRFCVDYRKLNTA